MIEGHNDSRSSVMTLSASLDIIPRRRTALEIEQCHAHIDKELATLSESMRALRSCKNALAYISLLPPEILATIFMHIVEEESYTGMACHYGTPLCLAVTHVCRHWRLVALECPTLWTSINCASVHWVDIMLERSKEAALVVTCSKPASVRQCFEQILSQLPRIKVLQLCSLSSDVNRITECLSSQPAPLLQIFKFSVEGGIHPRIDAIFQGCAPQLQRVELIQCDFSWTLGIFSGLRTLEVRRTASSSPTLSQLLFALRHMSALEQLTLDFLPKTSEDNNLFDKVSLAYLKRIVLAGFTIRTTISLFSHLLLPVDVKIALKLAQLVDDQSLFELCWIIGQDIGDSASGIRSMRARILSDMYGVQFSTSPVFTSKYIWPPPDGDIRLSIEFQCAAFNRNPAIIFITFFMVLHHKIQSLFLSASHDHDPGESFWRSGSAELPELESIHLSTASFRGLLDALYAWGTQDSDIAYPSLRALELENINFACGEPVCLHTTAMIRAGYDVGLHELRLVKCKNLFGDDVQLLRESVTDVEWDGREMETLPCRGSCRHCGVQNHNLS